MPMYIRKDEKKARLKIQMLDERVDDLRPVWPRVGRFMSNAVKRQFSSRGAYMGTPWKPLKPEYRLWKVRNGYPRSILVMTRVMKESFTGRPMNVERYFKQSAVFGSDERKVKWHQYGTKRDGKRVLPPRPMLKTTIEIRREVRDILKRYILRGL